MTDKIKDRLDEIKEDRRRDIIEAARQEILFETNQASMAVHRAYNQEALQGLKFGNGVRNKIKLLRKTKGLGEAFDKLMTLEMSGQKAQILLDKLMGKLVDKLQKPSNNDTPFRPLERKEAEEIVKEASDAWKSGIMNFDIGKITEKKLTIGDSSVDAHQNGNFNRPELPGQFRPDLKLPGKLFRQE